MRNGPGVEAHGTCSCYLTDGSREYVSFYVNDASKGYITMQRENVEAVPQASNDYHGGNDFDIWYDLNAELGITLEPHAKYYYQFYCEVGGEVYLSDVATFTTE